MGFLGSSLLPGVNVVGVFVHASIVWVSGLVLNFSSFVFFYGLISSVLLESLLCSPLFILLQVCTYWFRCFGIAVSSFRLLRLLPFFVQSLCLFYRFLGLDSSWYLSLLVTGIWCHFAFLLPSTSLSWDFTWYFSLGLDSSCISASTSAWDMLTLGLSASFWVWVETSLGISL